MSRTFWFAAGAGASVYAMHRARRVREVFTADGLRDRANALALGARLVREEVAQGRVEKETELRERLGLIPQGPDPSTRPQLEPGRPQAWQQVVPTGSTTQETRGSTP